MAETQVLDVEALGEGGAVTADAPPPITRLLPWAGISTATAGAGDHFTSQEMLAQAGLDWEVGIRPYQRPAGTQKVVIGGEWVDVDGQRALIGGEEVEITVPVNSKQAFETYRMDTGAELGMVRKRYNPLPNREAFDFADALAADGTGRWTHAGMQQGGKKLFMTMLLEEQFMVLGQNAFSVYLFMSGAHDGTRSLKGFVTPVNAFCTNQTNIITANNVGQFTIQHTSSMHDKLADAATAIRNAGAYSELLKAEAEALAATHITDDKARYMLLSVIPERRPKREEMTDGVMHLFKTSPTVADYRNTGWGLLNATTEYLDHVKTQRNGNARFESITFGEGAKYRLGMARALAELS
jgi:phage/plasmid-like protein (TIGR03299 family)